MSTDKGEELSDIDWGVRVDEGEAFQSVAFVGMEELEEVEGSKAW